MDSGEGWSGGTSGPPYAMAGTWCVVGGRSWCARRCTYLAGGVHLRCVPLGLVLEVDLVPLELGLGFSECELSLSKYVLSVNILTSDMYFEVFTLCAKGQICGISVSQIY